MSGSQFLVFLVLMGVIVFLSLLLYQFIGSSALMGSPSEDGGGSGGSSNQFVMGIVLTALAGAISSLLTFVGMIVKGMVDSIKRTN